MSTETVTRDEYHTLKDSRVRLVHNVSDDKAEEVFGIVEAVNPDLGVIMLREKGKSIGFLVEFDNVVEVELQPEPTKDLAQKVLKVLAPNKIRQHLLDRHGYLLENINGMDDSTAAALHDRIDHTPLGHIHQDGEAGEPGGSADGDASTPGE